MAADAAQPDVDLLAAALRADAADLSQFADLVAGKLQAMLPARPRVERRRAGFMGPKVVRRVRAEDSTTLQFELGAEHGAVEALVASVSGGIVLKRERVELDDWLGRLSAALTAEAGRSERARQTLEQWLT